MLKRLALIASILMLAVSCAVEPLPPIGREAAFKPQEDEQRLWAEAREEELALDKSAYVYNDPELESYLNGVAARLTPEEVGREGLRVTVKILKDPYLNAFAYPNGVIYLHTGMLSKLDNEAQLAALLGHEMTHFTHRHALKDARSARRKEAVLAAVRIATAPFGLYGDLAHLAGSVAARAMVTGYSRELESEADREGLDLMATAGYDPAEAVKLFEHIKTDLEEENGTEPYFFGTHPRIKERIESYNSLIKEKYAGKTGEKGSGAFLELVIPICLGNVRLDLAKGRLVSARKGIERVLKSYPDSPRAHYFLGEVYRQEKREGALENAEREYLISILNDPAYPDVHKMLGIVYYRQGKPAPAKGEFERYLDLAPDAKDRAEIEKYIREIKAD